MQVTSLHHRLGLLLSRLTGNKVETLSFKLYSQRSIGCRPVSNLETECKLQPLGDCGDPCLQTQTVLHSPP